MTSFADWLGRAFWMILAVAAVLIFSTDNTGVRWGIASVLIVLGLLPIVANWFYVVLSFRRPGPHPSMIPLLGGVLIAIAIARIPIESWNRWWWVAFAVDPSTWATLLAVPLVIRDVRRHRDSPGS